MKKFLVIGFMFLAISMFAQYEINGGRTKDINVLLEQPEYFGITETQKSKIITLKRNAGNDFETIGRNRNLSGYEKGVKKREVATKLQNDVSNVLNVTQRNQWADFYKKTDAQKRAIDKQIDQLEDNYDADIKKIERTYASDKTEMKRKKEARKAQYKKEKDLLKKSKR